MFPAVRVYPLASLVLIVGIGACWAKEEQVALGDVPSAVVESVKKRFPDAKITGAGKEDEEGQVVFELQLEDKSVKVDVSVNPDGTIREIEKQMVRSDKLPKAVNRALAEKYAKSKVKLVEQVILVKNGKETLDCYEFKLAVDEKITEVKIAPDGTIKHVEEKKGEDEGF